MCIIRIVNWFVRNRAKIYNFLLLRKFLNNWATNSSGLELCFRVMVVIAFRFSSPSPAFIERGFGIIWILLLDEFIFWIWEVQVKNKIINQGNVLILLVLRFFKEIKYLLFKVFFIEADQGNDLQLIHGLPKRSYHQTLGKNSQQ